MFSEHHPKLFRRFGKILVNHRPYDAINGVSDHIQNVFCHTNIFSWDNDPSEQFFDQIQFIVLLDGPDELLF